MKRTMKADISNKVENSEEARPSALKRINVALVGNPNSGKTTLFNALTGSHQHVGNYPGVTVEKKSGRRIHKEYEIDFIDLPGTYSLSAFSLEEKIARDFIVDEKPDLIVDVIDTSNLERNLYLAVQILELGAPMVLALNMYDEAMKLCAKLDIELLGELLGTTVVPTVASREKGILELLDAIIEKYESGKSKEVKVNYGHEIENAIEMLSGLLDGNPNLEKFPKRWVSLKLLENDDEIISIVGDDHPAVVKAGELKCSIESTLGNDPEMLVADQRYGFVAGICRETMRRVMKTSGSLTEKIDNILANRILGLPMFFFLMWLTFQLTFKIGAYPMRWMDTGIGYLSSFFSWLLPHGFVSSLIIEGIIGGVGGVIVFLPNILLLFLAIALLEDTGYMARVAFIMDKVMHLIGLHGKSFVPLLTGFGCNVPAIMATRTLENPKDRLATMLVVPFMSCGARLPVYILLAGAFFPIYAGSVIFIVYIIGIIAAILMALIFKRFLFHGLSTPFVMELPPYRLPTLKSVFMHMWRRAFLYLKKAGTVILIASIVVWLAMSIPIPSSDYNPELSSINDTTPIDNADLEAKENLENSLAGKFGKFIEPAIHPLGFDWKIGIALTVGFAAKEIVVSTLATVYAIGQSNEKSPDLQKSLQADRNFSPLVAFCLMIFTLLYSPCIPAISVLHRESGSIKWAWFAVGYTTAVAWIVTFIVYQCGGLLGFT